MYNTYKYILVGDRFKCTEVLVLEGPWGSKGCRELKGEVGGEFRLWSGVFDVKGGVSERIFTPESQEGTSGISSANIQTNGKRVPKKISQRLGRQNLQ